MPSLMTESIAKAKGILTSEVTERMRDEYKAEERIYCIEMIMHFKGDWDKSHKAKANIVADAMRHMERSNLPLITTSHGVRPVEDPEG